MFSEFKELYNNTPAIHVTGLGEYSLADTLECGQCFRFEKKAGSDPIEYVGVVER